MLYRVRLRTAANVDWRRTTRLAYGSLLDWVTPQTPHLTPHIPLYRYEERKTATVDEAEEREALAKARAGRCGRPPLEKSLAEERAEGSDDVRKVAA